MYVQGPILLSDLRIEKKERKKLSLVLKLYDRNTK